MTFAIRSAVAGLFFVSMFVVVSAGADKVVWEKVAVNGEHGVLQLKEGQTVQQALAPNQKPSWGSFRASRSPMTSLAAIPQVPMASAAYRVGA